MIVSSRKSLIPTYSTGRVVSSALSYVRFPYFREKERMVLYFIDNVDFRFINTASLGSSSLRGSLCGFHVNLWPNKREMGSQSKNFNFMDGAFRAARIFSILFTHKFLSAYNFYFLTKLISFVPKKTRFRKKNIFEALRFSLPILSRSDFYFFWRVYAYFHFLARSKQQVVDPRNVSSSKIIFKVPDLSGLYFLGAGVFNLEDYFLSFKFFISSDKQIPLSFVSLSTPKDLRSELLHKMLSITSHFRLTS